MTVLSTVTKLMRPKPSLGKLLDDYKKLLGHRRNVASKKLDTLRKGSNSLLVVALSKQEKLLDKELDQVGKMLLVKLQEKHGD